MPDILIADDHPLFRDALQRAVLTAVPQARVRPTPRSQVLTVMASRAVTWASEMLARSGKIG